MSLPVTSGGAYKHLAGKPVTTWAWTQWDSRPCPVVYRYKGEGKANGQTSGHHWDSLSSVRPEDRDICNGLSTLPDLDSKPNGYIVPCTSFHIGLDPDLDPYSDGFLNGYCTHFRDRSLSQGQIRV